MKPHFSSPPRLTHREARRLVRRSRRRGQALLLAVLLMVFAALLGATMITLVSSNLNQTTRQGGISGARASSSAAIAFVNDRLTNSLQGDLWRPWMGNTPPLKATSAADFNAYYTPFEQAQGWINEVNFTALPTTDTNDYNGNGITYQQASNPATLDRREQDSETVAYFDRQIQSGKRCYIKFPDPRGPVTNANGPQYLVQIAPTTGGALRVSVIGTNEDEPGAFDIRTAIKPTSRNLGPFSYARFDSNYDYNRKGLTRTKLSAAVTAATATITVDDVTGLLPGRAITISDNRSEAQSAVIKGVLGNTITLSGNITPPGTGYDTGTAVTAASSIMDGIMSADFNADGDAANTTGSTNPWETTQAPLRYSDTAAVNGSRSLFINGGVLTEGQTQISLGNGDRLKVAGLISPRLLAPAKLARVVDPTAPTTPAALLESNDTTTVRNALQQRVLDNRGPQSTHIQPLTPPAIDSADSRYRELTQFADVSGGSTYGYGPGVYINNGKDVDHFSSAQQLSVAESHAMYANRADTDLNKHYAYRAPNPTGTLEQRRIRGWVSPWEFLPRGTQIDLQGDKIVFTLDDRSDNAAYVNQPDPSKAWMGTGGAALTTPGTSTYRMVLNVNTGQRSFGAPGAELTVAGTMPFNGVIFLEGNARVRGFLKKGAVMGRDVTIVSMGSIFVEGSVVRDATSPATIADPDGVARAANSPLPPRIALLAKRDVVLNLTQSLARVPGAQDRDTAAQNVTLTADASGASSSFVVDTPTAFRVGDVVRAATDREWQQVTQINGSTLTIAPGVPANAARVATVRIVRLSDPALQIKAAADLPGATDDARTVYEMDSSQEQAFARDVRRDGVDNIDDAGATVNYALAWLHGGQRKEAIRMRRDHGGPGTLSIKKNRLPATPDTLISGAVDPNNEKVLAASDGDRTNGPIDLLNVNNNATRDGDTTETITALEANPTFQDETPIPPGRPADWKVLIGAGMGTVAARRLAGVGTTVNPNDDAPVVEGAEYSVPLTLGGRWNFQINWIANTNPLIPPVTNPALRVIGSSFVPEEDDDLETSREDFYQRTPGATPTQAPPRWNTTANNLTPAAVGSNVLTFNNDPGFKLADAPKYWIGPAKIEADDFAASTHVFKAVPVFVQATIFAQQGSWLVATPALQDVDDDHNGTANEAADISAATRYRRPNYRVFIKGSIVQNFAASGLVDFAPDPTNPANIIQVPGAAFNWINALSYPTEIVSDGAGAPAVPKGRGQKWQTIEYQPDPVPFYNGLYLPPTPDLLYTS